MPMTQKRVVPIDGSTVSHHAIITLAIRLSCSIVASCSHCQATSGGYSKLRRSIVSSFGHDRPSDARHLVGNGNGDELGRLLGQQPHDPGMLNSCRLDSAYRVKPATYLSGCVPRPSAQASAAQPAPLFGPRQFGGALLFAWRGS